MEMPPMLNWFSGRGDYGLFMEWVFEAAGKDWLLKEVTVNGGQPGNVVAVANSCSQGGLR
ncbi:hypothetical protein AB0G05_36960 [Nonomuraea wenchangensis]